MGDMTERTGRHGCGTSAGYVAHRRADEQACVACKAAWRKRQAEYRKSKRGGGAGQ